MKPHSGQLMFHGSVTGKFWSTGCVKLLSLLLVGPVFSSLVVRYLWVTRFISVKISETRMSCSRIVYLDKRSLASYGIPRSVAVFTSVHNGPYSVSYDPFHVLILIFSRIHFYTNLPSIDDLPRDLSLSLYF